MGADGDQVFIQHTLQFTHSLKDLRCLREQLYSAAEYFESSYDKDNHKQFVVESSKEYVAKALVSTVDHLGSVADKLNTFLDQNALDFSATNLRFSYIQQRLSTFQELSNRSGISRHLLTVEASGRHHKHYNVPADGSDLAAAPSDDAQLPNKGRLRVCADECISTDATFSKALVAARLMKAQTLPPFRKDQSRMASSPSLDILGFSFMKSVPNKESGKRSISPLRFPIRRTGSFTNRSVSPSPSANNQRFPSEPRRAISACRRHEGANREAEAESYTKRSKHLFKALLNVHRSRKEAVQHR